MPLTRSFTTRQGMTFHCPYFSELSTAQKPVPEKARLPMDIGAHALWHYYSLACAAWSTINRPVLVGEADPEFHSVQLFKAVAGMHGVEVNDMARYWPQVERQAAALGFDSQALPDKYKHRGMLI